MTHSMADWSPNILIDEILLHIFQLGCEQEEQDLLNRVGAPGPRFIFAGLWSWTHFRDFAGTARAVCRHWKTLVDSPHNRHFRYTAVDLSTGAWGVETDLSEAESYLKESKSLNSDLHVYMILCAQRPLVPSDVPMYWNAFRSLDLLIAHQNHLQQLYIQVNEVRLLRYVYELLRRISLCSSGCNLQTLCIIGRGVTLSEEHEEILHVPPRQIELPKEIFGLEVSQENEEQFQPFHHLISLEALCISSLYLVSGMSLPSSHKFLNIRNACSDSLDLSSPFEVLKRLLLLLRECIYVEVRLGHLDKK